MSKEQAVSRARWRWPLLLAGAAIIAAAVWLIVVRQSRMVRWSEVLAATTRQETVNGVGRIYALDGSEWAATVWVRIDGPNRFPANSLLLPLQPKSRQGPADDVVGPARAVNFFEDTGFSLPRLAAAHAASPGRPTQWSGRPVLEVDFLPSSRRDAGAAKSPFGWRLYVDRGTTLIQGLDLFDAGKVVAKVEYRYNLPLPAGFRAP